MTGDAMTGDDDLLLELVAQWEERRQHGPAPDVAELCPGNPALQEALRRLTVASVMDRDFGRVQAGLSVQAFAEEHLLERGSAGAPTPSPTAYAVYRDEYLVAMAVVAPGEVLTIYSGNSAPMKLKFDDLKQFHDKKGQRRQRFSRAYKQVDRLEVSAG